MKYMIKAEAQYRVNFITGIFSNLYTYLLMYMSIWILTHKFKTIAGWDYHDLTFLLALNLFSYSIAVTILYKYVSGLEKYINDGKFDRVLIRPLNPMLSMIYDGFAWMGIGQIIVSTIFLLNSLRYVVTDWDAYKVLVLVSCLIGGVFIQSGALIIFGSLSFWVKKSYDLSVIVFYNLKSFINYPLSIFSDFIQITLTFIFPWALINYYPALYLTGKSESNLYLLTPIMGLVILLFSIAFTQFSIKKYKSVGN